MPNDIDCRDCFQFKSIEKKVDEHDVLIKQYEIRLTALEKSTAVSDEQIKMVFKILNEIKESISKIAEKIESRDSRPIQFLWTIAGGVIVALLIAGLKFLN